MADEKDQYLEDLIRLALDQIDIAVTLIDTKGTLLYYNKRAAEILERKPEYIGKDVHSHHRKPTSSQKLDLMLEDFRKGRREPFRYEARPYGKSILVTLSPILTDGKFIGCVQAVQFKEDIQPKKIRQIS